MNLPQDNEELREKITQTRYSHFDHYADLDEDEKEGIDKMVALFQAEQTRLKAEWIAKLRESLPEKAKDFDYSDAAWHHGQNDVIDAVSAALDTLERGA